MLRCLLWVAAALLTVAPAVVGAGVWLQWGTGLSLIAGAGLYGLLAAWVLRADLLPEPAPEQREASR